MLTMMTMITMLLMMIIIEDDHDDDNNDDVDHDDDDDNDQNPLLQQTQAVAGCGRTLTPAMSTVLMVVMGMKMISMMMMKMIYHEDNDGHDDQCEYADV